MVIFYGDTWSIFHHNLLHLVWYITHIDIHVLAEPFQPKKSWSKRPKERWNAFLTCKINLYVAADQDNNGVNKRPMDLNTKTRDMLFGISAVIKIPWWQCSLVWFLLCNVVVKLLFLLYNNCSSHNCFAMMSSCIWFGVWGPKGRLAVVK